MVPTVYSALFLAMVYSPSVAVGRLCKLKTALFVVNRFLNTIT